MAVVLANGSHDLPKHCLAIAGGAFGKGPLLNAPQCTCSKFGLHKTGHQVINPDGEGADNFADIQDLPPAADSTIIRSYLFEDTDYTYTTRSVDGFL